MRSVSSAFFTRLQGDGLHFAELIDIETRNKSFHWTTSNQKLTYTLSGVPTVYEPFPGGSQQGFQESTDLTVSAIDFTVANTGEIFQRLMESNDLDFASVKVGRVFIDTPDLGRLEIFQGKLADYSYNRQQIAGQARNKWTSADVQFPYYTYQDNCVWRFGSAGCGFDTSSITLSLGSVVVGSCTTFNLLLPTGTLTASYSAGRFDFGRCTIVGGVNSGNIRTIRAHTGDLLMLSHPLPVNSFADMSIAIYPGCRKRLIADCKSIYNNTKNFLGFPWIPVQEDAFFGG